MVAVKGFVAGFADWKDMHPWDLPPRDRSSLTPVECVVCFDGDRALAPATIGAGFAGEAACPCPVVGVALIALESDERVGVR